MRSDTLRAFVQVRLFITAAGAAVLLLAALRPAHADSQNTVGSSPVDYTSPVKEAPNELKLFKHLVQLRDSGQISPAQYQAMLFQLASHDKKGVQMGTAPLLEDIAPIVFSPKSHPFRPKPKKPVTPPSTHFINSRVLLPAQPPVNKMQSILRPESGPVRVVEKEVANQ